MIKPIRTALLLTILYAAVGWCYGQSCVTASQVTLTGNLRNANGTPSVNNSISFQPSQQGFIAGCGVNLATLNYCGTSTDGSVVGIANPTLQSLDTTSGGGTLPAGTYYTVYSFYDQFGNVTLPSPETVATLSTAESLVVNPPSSGLPAQAVGMQVFIGTTSGSETFQGQTTGSGAYTQSSALVNGVVPASVNSTVCKLTANDAVWPTGTGYITTMTDSSGNAIPGYPMQWQLLGAGSTYNLSNGLPYYHGVVTYPAPILASPQNHGNQSISGSLSFGGYNVLNVGALGVGTSTPGWPLDVESGLINTARGYLVNGVAGAANTCLGSDGTAYDVPVNCGVPSLAYQTIDLNGVAKPQRPAINFTTQFTATDSPSPAQTIIGFAPSGVTAGSYTSPNFTVDTYGRVTAAVNGGSGTATTQAGSITGGCTTGGSEQYCLYGSITWPTPFSDNNYRVTCSYVGIPTGGSSEAGLYGPYISAKSASGVSVTIQAGSNAAGGSNTVAEIDCTAIHN